MWTSSWREGLLELRGLAAAGPHEGDEDELERAVGHAARVRGRGRADGREARHLVEIAHDADLDAPEHGPPELDREELPGGLEVGEDRVDPRLVRARERDGEPLRPAREEVGGHGGHDDFLRGLEVRRVFRGHDDAGVADRRPDERREQEDGGEESGERTGHRGTCISRWIESDELSRVAKKKAPPSTTAAPAAPQNQGDW